MAERVRAAVDQAVGPRMLDPKGLADYLDIPLSTVYQWRGRGLGPRGARVGRHVRYRLSDVEAWLNQQADRPA